MIYELLVGHPPFSASQGVEQYLAAIMRGEYTIPSELSPAAKDIIRRLLTVDVNRRLGCGATGSVEVFEHNWFLGIDRDRLMARELPVPIKPRISEDPFDTSNFKDGDKKVPDFALESTGKLKRKFTQRKMDDFFKDFDVVALPYV